MSNSSLFIIRTIIEINASIFGVLAAFFYYLDTAHEAKNEKTREWFREKWVSVYNSHWLNLAEKIIKWLLRCRASAPIWVRSSFEGLMEHEWIGYGLIMGIFILFILGYWIYFGFLMGILCLVITLLLFVIPFVVILPGGHKVNNVRYVPEYWINFWYLIPSAAATPVWILILLSIDIRYAFLLMLLVLAMYSLLISIMVYFSLRMFNFRADYNFQNHIGLFSIAMASSFTITFLALLIGHIARPDLWIPQTLQMLISNVIFDGFTMVATFVILSWAVARSGILRIPTAVFIDIVVAAVFACCSLFFGLVFTNKALSLYEIFNVLIVNSPDGHGLEIGPYFWAMHTTFLPTLFYLGLILCTWIGKAILTPIKWFFGKGQEHKHPLKLTAALCFLLATVFGFFAFVVNSASEYVKRQNQLKQGESLIGQPRDIGKVSADTTDQEWTKYKINRNKSDRILLL